MPTPVPQNPQDRALAEQSLRAFALSTDYVPHCRVCDGASGWGGRVCEEQGVCDYVREYAGMHRAHDPLAAPFFAAQTILDVSVSPYAQLMAISSLLKIISEHALRCVCVCEGGEMVTAIKFSLACAGTVAAVRVEKCLFL